MSRPPNVLCVVLSLSIALATAGAPAGDQPSKAPDEKAERSRLAGVWRGFTVEGKGENPDRGPVKLELTLTERTMRGIQIRDSERIDHGQGEYTLDLAADPPHLDAAQTVGRGRRRAYIGIYKLEGDTLRWCVSPQKVRPQTFETKKGQFLLILKRDKAKPASTSATVGAVSTVSTASASLRGAEPFLSWRGVRPQPKPPREAVGSLFGRRILDVPAALAEKTPDPLCPRPTRAILGTGGFWRWHTYWKPAARIDGAQVEITPGKHPFSSPPQVGWIKPDFDDSSWFRAPGPIFGGYGFNQPETLAVLCLRGKFEVTDPGRVERVAFSCAFRGGIVAYLNGEEIARSHLPDGQLSVDAPAEVYPVEVYTTPERKAITAGWGDPRTYKDRCDMRIRRLADVRIRAQKLRKGINVLAVEIHRAPTRKETVGLKGPHNWTGAWNHAGCPEIELVAAGAGITPNVSRPHGFQVWNCDLLQPVFETDFGDPNEPLRPIRIVGTANGSFSGKVVVSSDTPIDGLAASAGDLTTAGGGTIPARCVSVRYALPGGGERGVLRRLGQDRPRRFDPLAQRPRDSATVQPVWVTVRVPGDATPGEYSGTLSIRADGAETTRVPVSLKVCSYALPDPRDYRTHVGLVQSPDSVALEYKVPLWSDRHFELTARSLRLLGQVGNKTVFLPLICRTNFGNDESMVRWIARGDGTYDYDFTVMDRYLDLYEEHVGKPDVVCFYVWEPFAGGSYFDVKAIQAKGVSVSLLDPATGKVGVLTSPVFATAESETFWRPVFERLHAKMKQRGLSDDHLMLGIAGDVRPSKAITDFFLKIAPYASWVVHSHAATSKLDAAPVGYLSYVWGVRFAPDPDVPDPQTGRSRNYGWKQAFRNTIFPREGAVAIRPPLHTDAPLGTYRCVGEGALLADYRGFGRVGADFWDVASDDRGRPTNIVGRYSTWHQLNLTTTTAAVLAPGPDGAEATARFEMIREGVQECEARIAIEKALTTGPLRAKLGEELAAKLQDMLDRRTRLFRTACDTSWDWFSASGWQQRSQSLFEAAGAVAETLAR